ncbi:MAG: glycosyltransferase [Candidatus Helarchaeota archaeon]
MRYRGFFNEYEDGAPIKPPVSILINSKNEEIHIIECLKSLKAQNYPKENMEVIIIDESTDNTPQVIQNFIENDDSGMTVKLIRPKEPAPPNMNNLVYCLNLGIDDSKHDMIAFTEADCTPRKEWLRSLMHPLADPRVGFSGTHGIISGSSISATLQRLEYSGLLFEYTAGIDNIRRFLKMGGVAWAGSLGFRREVFENVGGYEGIEHIHIHEVALCAKFARNGYESRFIFQHDAKVDTAPHPSPVRQRLRWFRGTWQCREYKFHVATFGTYILPLILETASFATLILYFFGYVTQDDFNSAILTVVSVFTIKYITLIQFTRSPLLLKGTPLPISAVILYYFWLYLVQWLYFISIFTKPKTSWKEEEPPKVEIASNTN